MTLKNRTARMSLLLRLLKDFVFGGFYMYNPIRLHHIGIVMPNLEQAEKFMEKFGFTADYSVYVQNYQATCIYLKSGDSSAIELIIPEGGALKVFNRGLGGLHHIAIEVDNIEDTQTVFESMHMEMLEDKPITCDSGDSMNFLQLRFGEGVLVEFIQCKTGDK
jgi:lactoylglutathione lyase/methylmalonyl-CoA/ethylmalonyl-CoA epimerase